jgi:hypothetical protein
MSFHLVSSGYLEQSSCQKSPERRDELLGLFDKWEMTALRDDDKLGSWYLLVQILGGGEWNGVKISVDN